MDYSAMDYSPMDYSPIEYTSEKTTNAELLAYTNNAMDITIAEIQDIHDRNKNITMTLNDIKRCRVLCDVWWKLSSITETIKSQQTNNE
jgi:hypothetical protein